MEDKKEEDKKEEDKKEENKKEKDKKVESKKVEDKKDKNLSISPASLSVPGVPQSLRCPAALLPNTQLPQS